MAQSSGPISQGTSAERQFTDVQWRDLFGDEPGVLDDLDGTAYGITLPAGSNDATIGSNTQASVARLAGFAHRIPQSTPEPITIPAAVGSTRTDIISLRYDPAYTGLPGPVRLFRIAGSSSSIPAYDSSPPGVEDLPLWAVTRAVGQNLSQATVVRMFPRLCPLLELDTAAPLPTSSPLGTLLRQGTILNRRQLVSGSPAWVPDPPGMTLARFALNTASGTLAAGNTANLVSPFSLPAAPFGLGVNYKLSVSARVLTSMNPGLGGDLVMKVGSTTFGGDQFTNGGTTGCTYTFKADDIVYVNDNSARTITVSLTALGGTIALYPTYGRVFVEAVPYGVF